MIPIRNQALIFPRRNHSWTPHVRLARDARSDDPVRRACRVDHVSCTFPARRTHRHRRAERRGQDDLFQPDSASCAPAQARSCSTAQTSPPRSAPLRPTRAGRAFQLTNLSPISRSPKTCGSPSRPRAGVHYDMLRPRILRRDLIARADEILQRWRWSQKRAHAAAALSHGDQRKLEVALMMALEPRVFMFDEPTAGMSVDEAPVVLDLIARLKKDKSKIIPLVEHKMDVVRFAADRIIVLTNGARSPTANRRRDRQPGRAGSLSRHIAEEGGDDRRAAHAVRAHTHIGRYHILQGVGHGRAEGRTTMLLGRNGAGKTTTLHHHGIVADFAGRDPFRRRGDREASHPDIAMSGVAYVPETMAIFRPHRAGESVRLARRRA